MPLPRKLLHMTPEELDEFLTVERTARVATVSPSGEPHVVPLWFVWFDGAVYFTSLRKSRRQRDVEQGSRVAVCVDAGDDYGDLRGAVLYGRLEDATDDPRLEEARLALGRKYWGDFQVPEVKSHTFMRLRPDRVASWDFRKIPKGGDKRLEALQQRDEGS